MKRKVIAIIEKGSDGEYSIFAKDLQGVYGYGLTEEEAKKDFLEVLSEQEEYIKQRTGKKCKFDTKNVEYRYDLSGFFLSFPFFNVSEFARAVGVNASLLRRYKTGNAQASETQKKKIKEHLDEIVCKLQAVKF